ncbi:hypothetical protein [Amycolatopsis pigmentata]|uniref:Uncharacterized protein n=1 Tax=Amycolatopsis pigmentata TaxID=450801 RepID=A0ABW5FJ21_9PSEU
MATYVEIFLKPLRERSTQSVLDEISAVTQAPLDANPAYEDEAYTGIRDDVEVQVFVDHGYEDDDDMPFSSHPYMLRFRTLTRDVDSARAHLERAYADLKKAGNYSMFSTYDLQYLLESDVVTR